MKFRTMGFIQMGDIHDFNKMINDAIHEKNLLGKVDNKTYLKDDLSDFSYNDTYYQFNENVSVDVADS